MPFGRRRRNHLNASVIGRTGHWNAHDTYERVAQRRYEADLIHSYVEKFAVAQAVDQLDRIHAVFTRQVFGVQARQPLHQTQIRLVLRRHILVVLRMQRSSSRINNGLEHAHRYTRPPALGNGLTPTAASIAGSASKSSRLCCWGGTGAHSLPLPLLRASAVTTRRRPRKTMFGDPLCTTPRGNICGLRLPLSSAPFSGHQSTAATAVDVVRCTGSPSEHRPDAGRVP